MTIALTIFGWWVVANLTIAPIAVWLFFRADRRAMRNFKGWAEAHPDAPPAAMPPDIAAAYFRIPHQAIQAVQ